MSADVYVWGAAGIPRQAGRGRNLVGVVPGSGNTANTVAVVGGDGTATLSWTAPTDTTNLSGYLVGRDGTDVNGVGPWSTTKAVGTTSQSFSNLTNGVTYNVYVEPQYGIEQGTRTTLPVTPAAVTPDPGDPAVIETRADYGVGDWVQRTFVRGAGVEGQPEPWYDANCTPGDPANYDSVFNTNSTNAVNRYAQGDWTLPPLPSSPMLSLSVPLYHPQGGSKSARTQAVLSCVEMAKFADGFYDTQLNDLGTAINTKLNADSTLRVVLRPGHEHNGDWYGNYSGWDPRLGVGGSLRSSLLSSASATGRAGVSTLCQAVADSANGNRGPVFAEAFRRCHDRVRAQLSVANNLRVIFDWNPAAPGADPTNEDPTASGILSRAWNPDSWPGAAYVDVIGMDLYLTPNEESNPTLVDTVMTEHASWCDTYGKPASYPEIGFRFYTGISDAFVANTLNNKIFPHLDSRPFAYLQWWHRTNVWYRPDARTPLTLAALAARY